MRIKTSLATTVAVLASLVAVASPAAAAPTACPSVNRAWSAPGPFSVTKEDGGPGTTVYRPTALASSGCASNPVIIWGNGTFATPGIYDKLLRHLASHGFIVAAANTTQSGSGKEMLAGLDWLTKENSRSGSPYQGKVDLDHVGATGHSQGGGGSINAGEDSRVDTVVPIQPGPQGTETKVRGSILYLAGEKDGTVNPDMLVIPRYNKSTHTVAVYAELAGAGHMEATGDAGGFRGPITAWFRHFLMADPQARGEFFGADCVQCGSKAWSDFRRNAKAQQVSATS